ncbi:MAG TPA: hypothetical protein VGJ26_05515 [Pirellulales bacterium]|jgi:hypothetical protein
MSRSQSLSIARSAVLIIGYAGLLGFYLACAAGLAGAAETLRFTYKPLDVGDQASETSEFGLDLKTTVAQGHEVINVAAQKAERNERITAERLPTEKGQTARARIKYEASDQVTTDRSGAVHGAERPVAGKTYVATREGEQLVIADEQGAAPPEEEFKIVTRAAEGLGRPNPIGELLNGKTVAIGERISLPQEYCRQMLSGWDDSLTDAPLEVMLMGTQRIDGRQCALFHTVPEGLGQKSNIVRTSATSSTDGAEAKTPPPATSPIQGKFLIELDTCRLAVIELDGPVNRVETKGRQGREFEVRRKGKLHVAVHVTHNRVEK